MTAEQIKASTDMRTVIGMYGYEPNRAGFICCPFHGEKTASMKIYKDSFNCFGCGANGDIFTFVELIENCSFKEAYKRLGGTYEGKMKDSTLGRITHLKRAKQTEINRHNRLQAEYVETCNKLHFCQKAIAYAPRDSDIYAEALKKVDYLNYKLDYLFEELDRKG
jgi:DNA primase